MADEHLGHALSIKGFTNLPMAGDRRHALDTDSVVILTLYGQDGEMQILPVARTRDAELFQEWLRRFDRYTPGGKDDPDQE